MVMSKELPFQSECMLCHTYLVKVFSGKTIPLYWIQVFHKHTNLAIYWHYCQLYIPKYLVSFFKLYLHHMVLLNVKLDINGHKRIICQSCKPPMGRFICNGTADNISILIFWRVCETLYYQRLNLRKEILISFIQKYIYKSTIKNRIK